MTTMNKTELIKYLNSINFSMPDGFEQAPDMEKMYTVERVYEQCEKKCEWKNCDECPNCPIQIRAVK